MANCGTVTVVNPDQSVTIVTCSLSDENPTVDQEVTVEVSMQNSLDSQACVFLEFVANGMMFSSLNGECVTIGPNSTATVSATFTPSGVNAGPGENFDVSVEKARVDVLSTAAPRMNGHGNGDVEEEEWSYQHHEFATDGGCGCGCGGCGH